MLIFKLTLGGIFCVTVTLTILLILSVRRKSQNKLKISYSLAINLMHCKVISPIYSRCVYTYGKLCSLLYSKLAHSMKTKNAKATVLFVFSVDFENNTKHGTSAVILNIILLFNKELYLPT